MNTDKIYAESIANEYAPKDTSKVLALGMCLAMQVNSSPEEFHDMRVLSAISGAAIYLAIVIISVHSLVKGVRRK